MTEKMTKKDYYNEIIVLATDAERIDLVDFCNAQIAAIEKKAAKAKETAAAKKVADPLVDVVLAGVTDELSTIADIVARTGDPDLTVAKATSRLKKLVDAGTIVKDTIKVDKANRVAYKLA